MLGQLFIKECRQMIKSLTYWLVVLAMIFMFSSQLGSLEIMSKPVPGEDDYGVTISKDKDVIMGKTLGMLAEEYYREGYSTYPIGFYKHVTLSKEKDKKIGAILKETIGTDSREEIGRKLEEWYASQEQDTMEMPEAFSAIATENLTYERFEELMDEADDILGGGSGYGESYRARNAMVPMTYEDALEEYQTLIEKDRLTGGYARLFSDYMVIEMGILPVFPAVARGLRDRRAGMQELIYTRRCSAGVILLSRYLAMLVMLFLPLLIISFVPLTQCIEYGKAAGIVVDLLAFVKYILGWLMPTVMAAAAIGMFLTELTDTALAVLVQGVWWFCSLFMAIQGMSGGMYGWNLMPRHNTETNWEGYHSAFLKLAANRLLYVVLSLILMALTAYVFAQKRKGRLQIRGKILANRKGKSKA